MKISLLTTLFLLSFHSQAFSNDPVLKCKTSGCNGVMCVNSKAEDLMSTCEYRSYYRCFREHSTCKAINNKCQWESTPGLVKCLQEEKAPKQMTDMYSK